MRKSVESEPRYREILAVLQAKERIRDRLPRGMSQADLEAVMDASSMADIRWLCCKLEAADEAAELQDELLWLACDALDECPWEKMGHGCPDGSSRADCVVEESDTHACWHKLFESLKSLDAVQKFKQARDHAIEHPKGLAEGEPDKKIGTET